MDPIHHLIPRLSDQLHESGIRLAWEDRSSFEEIEERTGLVERQVTDMTRRELKPASFRSWRKRVTGRLTKRRTLLERSLKKPPTPDAESG